MASNNRVYPDIPPSKLGPADAQNLKSQALPTPATYARRTHGQSACPAILVILLGIGAILGSLFGVAFLMYWIIIHPQLPNFDVQNVKVTGLDGSLNSTNLNTSVSFTLLARNPNRELGLYYDNMSIAVETRHQRIGDGTIGAFYQGHKSTTILYADAEYKGLVTEKAISNLNAEHRDSFRMKLKMDTKVRTKLSSRKSHKFKLKVRCDLTVDLLSAGTPILHEDCDLDQEYFDWWW